MYNYENIYDDDKTTKEIKKEGKYVLTKKGENTLLTLTLEVAKEKFHERKYIQSLKYLIMHIKYKFEFTYKELINR